MLNKFKSFIYTVAEILSKYRKDKKANHVQ
jgi:hypothetical protein